MALLTAGTANEDGPLDHDLLNVMAPNGYGGDGGNGGDAGGGEGGAEGFAPETAQGRVLTVTVLG